MKITEEWLRSVGFKSIGFSDNSIPVDLDGAFLCIDFDDGHTVVSLYDSLDGCSVCIRPLNTQEEVRQLYKLLSEEEL